MNERDSKSTAKLIHKLVKQSPSSIEMETDDIDETLQEMDSLGTDLHVYIGKIREDDELSLEWMSVEEYKYYINKKIYEMPIHSTGRKADYTIHVTQEGLFRMKEDYEYEEYVLESIRIALKQPIVSPFSDHFLLYFTDNKDECYGMSCGPMDPILEYGKEREGNGLCATNGESRKGRDKTDDMGKQEKWRLERQIERQRRQKEYFELREGKRISPGKPLVNPSKLARMYYAYNIVPKESKNNIDN